jgi:hypothetical protein
MTEHGDYRQAPALNNFAFEQIEDLWDEPLDESHSSKDIAETPARTRANLPEVALPVPQGRRQALTSLYATIRQSKDKLCLSNTGAPPSNIP